MSQTQTFLPKLTYFPIVIVLLHTIDTQEKPLKSPIVKFPFSLMDIEHGLYKPTRFEVKALLNLKDFPKVQLLLFLTINLPLIIRRR